MTDRKPLETLELTTRQLRDARYELATRLSLSETGCVIHGLRRVIQCDPPANAAEAQRILDRLLADPDAEPLGRHPFPLNPGD